MPKKLSKRKACAFAKEEAHTAKLYAKYGFKSMAKDEARHSRNFKKIASKEKK